jgi:hypothetical protein
MSEALLEAQRIPLPPSQFSTAQAALRVWIIRQLRSERAIDPLAGDLALRSLSNHPNPRVAALAQLTLEGPQ